VIGSAAPISQLPGVPGSPWPTIPRPVRTPLALRHPDERSRTSGQARRIS
jgi:hypothetical protein